MPRGEDFFDQAKSPPAHNSAGAAIVDDFAKIAFQMGPAKLTSLLWYHQVHVPTITGKNPFDFLTQECCQTLGTPLCMDDEDGDVRRGRGP